MSNVAEMLDYYTGIMFDIETAVYIQSQQKEQATQVLYDTYQKN